jgi:hypothetical protein
VLGESLPPLGELLDGVDAFLEKALADVPRTLCHGDLHLANVMARRRGRGFSVRLLDPNPIIGISDPLYDAGKLLHWSEPVGWLVAAPSLCRTHFRATAKGYELGAEVVGAPAGAERRREVFEATVRERLARVRRADPTRAPRLEIATASAHVGMASLYTGAEQMHERRFALAYTLAALARFRRAVESA